MPHLIVPNEAKIPKEALLLGDVEIVVKDCEGNDVSVHGLTANDLVIKNYNGTTQTLVSFIQQSGGTISNVGGSLIVDSQGTTHTMQEVVDGLVDVQFEIADLQAKYNNL